MELGDEWIREATPSVRSGMYVTSLFVLLPSLVCSRYGIDAKVGKPPGRTDVLSS